MLGRGDTSDLSARVSALPMACAAGPVERGERRRDLDAPAPARCRATHPATTSIFLERSGCDGSVAPDGEQAAVCTAGVAGHSTVGPAPARTPRGPEVDLSTPLSGPTTEAGGTAAAGPAPRAGEPGVGISTDQRRTARPGTQSRRLDRLGDLAEGRDRRRTPAHQPVLARLPQSPGLRHRGHRPLPHRHGLPAALVRAVPHRPRHPPRAHRRRHPAPDRPLEHPANAEQPHGPR